MRASNAAIDENERYVICTSVSRIRGAAKGNNQHQYPGIVVGNTAVVVIRSKALAFTLPGYIGTYSTASLQ
jgi:hypothetical protein